MVWTNIWAPTELIWAAGLTPMPVESLGASATIAGCEPTALAAAEGTGTSNAGGTGVPTPRDSCTFCRATVGMMARGALPPPRLVCCTSTLCDAEVKMTANAAARFCRPFTLFEVPYDDDNDAIRYLTAQLEQFGTDLFSQMHIGEARAQQRLQRACRRSNRARTALARVATLRRKYPGVLAAEDALEWLYGIYQMFGSKRAVRLYQGLAREVEARVEAKRAPAGPEPRHRLLWLHLAPYYPHDIFETLADHDAAVVYEEYNDPYWEPLDPDRPYRSLARKLMNNHQVGPVTRRVERILDLVDANHIDGVIHFNHWGCRQSVGALRVVRNALLAREIPFLALDGDCLDRREYHAGQVRTRLEGFLEIVGGHS